MNIILRLGVLACMFGYEPRPEPMRFLFIVTVPADTPENARVYVSGGLPELGNWSGKGLELKRGSDGRFVGSVKLPLDSPIEYKLTLGDWARVEKDRNGNDIANRKFTINPQLPRTEIMVERWGQPADAGIQQAHTVTGNVRLHADIASRNLGNNRTIAVWLPPGYEENRENHFAVLYMHDGQNLFDAATSFAGEWKADETATRLIKDKKIEPIIIVGIYNNAERMNEYSPDRDAKRNAGGRGADYARFVVEEVKPFIDRTYRTRPDRANTGVAGSSMGGLISLYMCWKYPNVFSKCGIISPALMWNDASILTALEKDHDWMKGISFWLDMGTAEGKQINQFSEAVSHTQRLARIFDSAGLRKDRDYYYLEVKDGRHNEGAWADRFDKILLFLYPATK